MTSQRVAFEYELRDNPALCEHILETLPPVKQAEQVVIRTDTASVDAAICKALVLAVEGVEARIELVEV